MKTNAPHLPREKIAGGRIHTAMLWLVVCLLNSARMANAAEVPATYPVMPFTPAQVAGVMTQHFAKPFAPQSPNFEQNFPVSLSLLSRLPYVPAERNQGGCGNCWAWAGTGVMEIAHNVQNGVRDRLSVQLINSCNTTVGCCEGGWLSDVAGFYTARGAAVPWSNPGAAWSSGNGSCGGASCGNIAMSPGYPVTRASVQSIATHGTGHAQAIANIKDILNQNRAMWFGFFMADYADWTQFFNFWNNHPETTVWSDFYCGQSWNDGAGHAVLCVGYNEDDPANPYWIMVNSWGTAGGRRPNGVFRVSMNLNYDCTAGPYRALYWQTLDVQFGGPSAVYVDWRYTGTDADGTFARPFPSVTRGVAATPACGLVRIRAGAYDEQPALNRCTKLESYDGRVRIGPGATSLPPPGVTAPQISLVARRSDGMVPMSFTCAVGQRYQVLASTNLVNWTLWKEFTADEEQVTLVDAEAASHPMRFFKVVVP